MENIASTTLMVLRLKLPLLDSRLLNSASQSLSSLKLFLFSVIRGKDHGPRMRLYPQTCSEMHVWTTSMHHADGPQTEAYFDSRMKNFVAISVLLLFLLIRGKDRGPRMRLYPQTCSEMHVWRAQPCTTLMALKI